MKAIDIRFLLMGIFFLLYGIVRKNIFIVIVGGAFLLYSFYSKKMEPTKKNIFKPELKLRGPKKPKSKKGKKKCGILKAESWRTLSFFFSFTLFYFSPSVF